MKRAVESRRGVPAAVGLTLAATCWTSAPPPAAAETAPSAEAYRVVDCLLPGQVRKLGRSATFITPRRPIRTSGVNCEIRGGEYVSADRADFASSLGVWLPSAERGDPKAQAYVGRIYADGLGRTPDYVQAAGWYQKAADQGYPQAMIDLGQLYERGLGVPRDAVKAVSLYRKASGLPPSDFASAQAVLGEPQSGLSKLNAAYEAARADAQAMSRELESLRADLAKERAALAQARADLQRPRAPPPGAEVSPAQLKSAEAARTQALQQRDYVQRELAALRAQLPDAQGRLADVEADAAQARKAAAQANGRLAAALAGLEAREAELAAMRAHLAQEQAKAAARAGDQDAAARLRSAQADYDRISRDLDRTRADAEARRTEIAAAERALQAREAEVVQARTAAAAAEMRLAKAQADLRERDLRLQASEARLGEVQGHMAQVQRDFDAAAQRSAELSAQVAGLQKDLARSRQDVGAGNADLAAREARVAAREARMRELEAKLTTALGTYRTAASASVPKTAPATPSRLQASPKFGFSTSYALLIGESNYRDPKLQKLATPGNDVTQLGQVLRGRYGFTVEVLLDKSRTDILRALDALSQKLGDHDTLLIYYAGHGGMEKVRNGDDRGYWLPVDAEFGSSASQISNQEITYQVARMAARKVLIVADSCYSGLLTQTVSRAQRPVNVEDKTNDYLIGMAWKQSRNVLTSGRLEPVLDGGGAGNHSVFAAALIDVLKSNTDVITSEEIYSRLVARVMSTATRALIDERDTPNPQQPTYSALDNGGHVYGDFLFVPKSPT